MHVVVELNFMQISSTDCRFLRTLYYVKACNVRKTRATYIAKHFSVISIPKHLSYSVD